jgi:hypothetical protein
LIVAIGHKQLNPEQIVPAITLMQSDSALHEVS